MPLGHRIVVHLERLLAFLHLADDERVVDDRFEPADRRALFEREYVDGFDRRSLAVHVALGDDDAGAER